MAKDQTAPVNPSVLLATGWQTVHPLSDEELAPGRCSSPMPRDNYVNVLSHEVARGQKQDIPTKSA
ncbi:MAG: hypothetical protein ABWY45_02590 [Mycobacterium sp.]